VPQSSVFAKALESVAPSQKRSLRLRFLKEYQSTVCVRPQFMLFFVEDLHGLLFL